MKNPCKYLRNLNDENIWDHLACLKKIRICCPSRWHIFAILCNCVFGPFCPICAPPWVTPQPHELFFSWKMSWVAGLYTCFMQANGDLFIFFFHFFSCPIWVHGGAHGGAGFCTFTTPHCATPHHLCPKTPLWCPLRPTRLKIILHTRIYQVFWFFKYFGHFCHFWAFGGRSPPEKWRSAHRIQCGVYLRVPTPSTNPTTSSHFWHPILLWSGVWFDTPQCTMV